MAQDVLAIGVDGGASGVRALAVRLREDGTLETAGKPARRDHAAFASADAQRQQAEVDSPRRDADEVAAARARVLAAADVVREAAGDARRIALGLCWPGRKTSDGRGVALMWNGPRDPALLDELECELTAHSIELASPIPPLASDGVAGALGERRAAHGLLRDVDDALYFAGGTGLAESVLVAGRVRALDELTHPLPKAFELPFDPSNAWQGRMLIADAQLRRFEDVLAPGGWSRDRSFVDPILTTGFPSGRVDWLVAFQRDPRRVQHALDMASSALVGYIEDRMRRLRETAGIVPERAVVGARLGMLLAHPDLRVSFHDPVVHGLERIGLPPDFVRASTLLEAPCFGAAALALGLEDRACRS